MKNKKFSSVLLAVLLVFCAVFSTACGKSQPTQDTNNPSQPTTESTPDTDIVEWAPFVSKDVYDAYNLNNDVVGWLALPGCDINNRVFQAVDNDYYLRLNEEGEYDIWGCYFLDYINVNDGYSLPDKVSIIYGHALDDDAESEKFSKLKRYKNADFALANAQISFDLLYANTSWQIFSACDIPITIDYIDPNPDSEKYTTTLEYMLTNSYVDFGVDVTAEDKILVLSTCTSNPDVRFVVAAKYIG